MKWLLTWPDKEAPMRVSMKSSGHSIGGQIMEAINEFVNKPIEGAVTVDGHDYWWILEYGSGSKHERVSSNASLSRPSDAVGETPVGGWYPITAKFHRNKRGELSLHFWHSYIGGTLTIGDAGAKPGESGGRWRGDLAPPVPKVMHPGIKPHAFVRASVRNFYVRLRKSLTQLKKDKANLRCGIPTRKALVAMLNWNLQILLNEIQMNTPESREPWMANPEGHLSDAWRLRQAR